MTAPKFGWNFEELERQNRLRIVFTTPQVLDAELRSPDSLLLEMAAEIDARRIFIDGIGLLHPAPANGDHPPDGPHSYRELLQHLLEAMNRENLATMFSHELGRRAESLATLEAATFLSDTVIELGHDRHTRVAHRSVEIIKSRGQRYVAGKHTLQIIDGQGLEIFRRVQVPDLYPAEEPTSSFKSSVIGVPALDDLIGGGFFDGSTTMVVGVSGVGKTVLAAQILLESARSGKRVLLVSLDEHPAQILRNALTLGLDLQAQMDEGMIHIFYESPQELEIDAHFTRIVRAIEKFDIQRLVIDGVTSYSTALEDQRAYRDFFHALVAYTKLHLMTTVFNYENPELFGISAYMPEFPVNSIVDNIILLSLVELGSSIHRSIAVVKARGCKHQFDTREFAIGAGGIRLIPADNEGKLPALPIESYSSVLSRAPTRVSPRRVNGEAVPPSATSR